MASAPEEQEEWVDYLIDRYLQEVSKYRKLNPEIDNYYNLRLQIHFIGLKCALLGTCMMRESALGPASEHMKNFWVSHSDYLLFLS